MPVNQFVKTYFGLVFVALALFEFWTAMRVFGKKGKPGPHAVLLLRVHRVGGYAFLIFALLLAWVGLGMLERYYAGGNYHFGPRQFGHALLAVMMIVVLFLKIGFIRFYRNYRPYVPMLGIVVVALTVVIWVVAGLMFLFMMGGSKVVT